MGGGGQGTVKCKSFGIRTKRSNMSDTRDLFIYLRRSVYLAN